VILADYNMEKGYQALKQLCFETNCNEKNLRLMECDLRSFESVRKFVKLYNKEEKRLDVLICNAGIAWAPNQITQDGFNTVIQVNYLSHFLLTNLLLDKIKQCQPSRIVYVASGSHRSK
jgi:NAD(P)-dependent dehydrogenase (short-subunit alcohol dehydrogenase family)